MWLTSKNSKTSFKPNSPKSNLNGKVYRNEMMIPSKIKRSMTNAKETTKKLQLPSTSIWSPPRMLSTEHGTKALLQKRVPLPVLAVVALSRLMTSWSPRTSSALKWIWRKQINGLTRTKHSSASTSTTWTSWKSPSDDNYSTNVWIPRWSLHSERTKISHLQQKLTLPMDAWLY